MTIDPGELAAATAAVRNFINSTAYGAFVSDEECKAAAAAVVTAVENYRAHKGK